MKIPIYQIDAFTSQVFSGNPAAVCPLEAWLDDRTLQAIAAENNLSETAFFVAGDKGFHIRWFTPVAEVDLCGHATLASAHVLFNDLNAAGDEIRFSSKSGPLTVTLENGRLVLDFPAEPPRPCAAAEGLAAGLGRAPDQVLKATDYFAVYEDEAAVAALAPDFQVLQGLDGRGVIVTAPGDRADFVSRFFAPKFGIPEDPVTGSAHCLLTPYWAGVLGKRELHALQISSRGGELFCSDRGERVLIAGRAVKYLEGFISVP
jgi:PhzF family phenazine biosynthesis protein